MSEISLNLVRLTESYAICLSTEGESPRTIEWYTTNLTRFARFLKDNQLSYLTTRANAFENAKRIHNGALTYIYKARVSHRIHFLPATLKYKHYRAKF